MALGFRVVRTKNQQPSTKEEYSKEPEQERVSSKTSPVGGVGALKQGPYFRYVQYVNIPKNQTKFPYGGHNHDPAIVTCPDGSLLAIFFPRGMRKDREQGLASTRLHDLAKGAWTTPVAFYNEPARFNSAPAFLSLNNGEKLYQWMAVSPVGKSRWNASLSARI